jgi:hypothetical protein
MNIKRKYRFPGSLLLVVLFGNSILLLFSAVMVVQLSSSFNMLGEGAS